MSGIYKPLEGFETFEEDDLPSNSDVTFIFEQYLNCLEKLRGDNVVRTSINTWYWLVDEKESSIKTSPPKKLTNK